jgi:hypothetical protein
VGYRIVVHYLVASRQDKHFFLLVDSFSLGNEELEVSERLTKRVITCFVAEGNPWIFVCEDRWALEWDPLLSRLGHKVHFVDGRSVLLAITDEEVD